MSKRSYAEHSFYCINCGNKGIPIARNQGFKHKKMHRKKLYCVHCRTEINHIECRTFDEVIEFKENFMNGVYKDEAKDCLSFISASSSGKEFLGSL